MRTRGHNCMLCKKEWLGRCFSASHYGEDVGATRDYNICKYYIFGGSEETLKEIEEFENNNLTK